MRNFLLLAVISAVMALSACGEDSKSGGSSQSVNQSSSFADENSSSVDSSSTSADLDSQSVDVSSLPAGGDSAYNKPPHRDDEYTSTVSDFLVEFDDGEAEILCYNGAGGDVIIPAQIENMRVTEIESRAFENCYGLISVTIPGSIESIGEDAFANCVNLSSVTIENGVREIDEYAFSGCTSLTRLDIPDSVMEIERFAFSGRTDLTVSYHGRTYSGDDIMHIYND